MFKALIKELKRYNDIREKELDLKMLDQFDFQKKWKVWPKQEVTTPQVVIGTSGPVYESHAHSSLTRYPW